MSNYSGESCKGYSVFYSSGPNAGKVNTRRFINTLDYSLDLIKLREVYEKIYRRMDFSFNIQGKDYCKSVINVTFKYSVKEYNLFHGNTYIKLGYLPCDIELKDCVCMKDGELIAIRVESPVENPVAADDLGKYFTFENGEYRLNKAIKVVHTVADLRTMLYRQGFSCDGVHYRRFKRSSGSSRVGKCLFIDDRLYDRMHKWEMCGLKVDEGQEVDLAALEAYIALTLSSIIGTILCGLKTFLLLMTTKVCSRIELSFPASGTTAGCSHSQRMWKSRIAFGTGSL